MNTLPKWLTAGAGLAAGAYAAYVASTWLHFGRPAVARRAAKDALLDEFMRDFDVRERHVIPVAAPAEVTLAAAREIELQSSPVVRAIFRARELLLGSTPDTTPRPAGLVDQMKAIGWAVLAEDPGREIVMGAVTRPWEPNPAFRAVPPGRFAAFAESDYVKIAWTLRVRPGPSGGCVFSTETRAVATDDTARREFRLYWSFLSPGIILIRAAMLPVLEAAAERRWRIEGDDILPDADTHLTHAVTIDAPAQDVWPWLVQMGCRRAGWYSWDLLDNAGVRSAECIVPELQHLEVGDVLPARPGGAEGVKVRRNVPERALVLDGTSPQWAGTWAFELQPLTRNRTRLVTRYRAAYPPSPRMAMALPVLAAVHAFMERKQLRTIKHHAEHMHAVAAWPPRITSYRAIAPSRLPAAPIPPAGTPPAAPREPSPPSRGSLPPGSGPARSPGPPPRSLPARRTHRGSPRAGCRGSRRRWARGRRW
jgi:hypothetical protein